MDSKILLNALSLESIKTYLPHKLIDYTNIKTDLFTFRCAIYFIIISHKMFLDLDKFKHKDEIERRFCEEDFPTNLHVCTTITVKC
jgi:hypothetical protein